MEIQVGVSNRHIHLTQEDLEKLFGKGFQLEIAKPLVQQGEFASTSFVTIKTEKNSINKVRVLGPIRDYTQVEVSKTDSFLLGINPPIRNSGDLNNSETFCLSINLPSFLFSIIRNALIASISLLLDGI